MAGTLFRRPSRRWLWPVGTLLLLVAAVLAAYELIASPFQAMFLAHYAARLDYQLEAGKSDSIVFPEAGPYDIRLGYVGLPSFIPRLQARGYDIAHQARISPEMAHLDELGLYLPYREKTVAGLDVRDCQDNALYVTPFPRQAYKGFKDVSPVVANTLLFIENRELLDANHPQRNPAVEWDRLVQALLEKAMQIVDPHRNVPGGSTLATQIEKYRHSPDGLTLTASDKLRQMASASLRAYLDGPDTRATRQRIVLDYLNTVPLAAAPGFGEVHGLGEGLKAWFGLDFAAINRLLARPSHTPQTARAYKHVLALLISQRKPSWYLLSGHKQLDQLADVHLRLLAEAGVITPAFRDLALREQIRFAKHGSAGNNGKSAWQFIERKAASAIRVELAQMLGVPSLYDLDRLDLRVASTLHVPTQRAISDFLSRLNDPVVAEAAELYGPYLLSRENDLSKPIYSFTLHELSPRGALLRVRADNLNQPFDINQGAKLDMGSSAKLRTLITYLQIIAELHARYAKLDAKQLAAAPVAEKDELSRWALRYLAQAKDKTLQPMLEAALSRVYSASPNEGFYTGGGIHRFANFNREDDSRVMDLWEATRNSVNLPFIRLMRDIVRHLMYRAPSTAGRVLADAQDPQRRSYLLKFADREGRTFLSRFYRKYKGLTPAQATANLINHLAANPKRLAAVFRYVRPEANLAAFTALLKRRLSRPDAYSDDDFAALYTTYGPDKFNLSDRGYITQIHPLELWLVAYMHHHPKAGWNEIVQASAEERVAVYDWLFKTSRKNAQDIRIQSLLEIEAFQEIQRRWRRLGYPFSSLVPSYATAIGSSADRPMALAELMGVILNDGAKLPSVSLTRLEFAADTPYHTVLQRPPPRAERLFPTEVAVVVRKALTNVVQEGTARRLRSTFVLPGGGTLALGGKTGTGDHRYETYSADGRVLESKVVNRTATFAFFLGKRFFGVMTVFVPGEAAADYHFTSGLAVQLLKDMEPALRPLVMAAESAAADWDELVRRFEAEDTALPGPVPAPPGEAGTGTDAAPPQSDQAKPGQGSPGKSSAKPGQTAVQPRPSAEVPRSPLPPSPPSSEAADAPDQRVSPWLQEEGSAY